MVFAWPWLAGGAAVALAVGFAGAWQVQSHTGQTAQPQHRRIQPLHPDFSDQRRS